MKKSLLKFLTGAVATISLSSGIVAYSESKENALWVTTNIQEKSNWCWAAASKSIGDYVVGKQLSQSDIVKEVKGSVVDETASVYEINYALRYNGVSPTFRQAPLSKDEVKTEIDSYRPMMSIIKWTFGGGHTEVISGYTDNGTDLTLHYMDPAQGSTTWNLMKYDRYVSNNSFRWLYTFYKNKRL